MLSLQITVLCLPVITDNSQCSSVGTDPRFACLSYRTIYYLFVQITFACLPVGTDDRCACLSYLTIKSFIFKHNGRVFTYRHRWTLCLFVLSYHKWYILKIKVACLPIGTDDRCACLYSRIVRIRSTGNVHPVSHTLQR